MRFLELWPFAVSRLGELLRSRGISHDLLRGSLLSMCLRVAGVALSYFAHVLLSRFLGLQGYGQYVIALGWALVLVLPARLGFDNSALRYATIYFEEGDSGALRGFIRTAAVSVTAASLAIGAVMILIGGQAPGISSYWIVAWAAAIILPVALLGVFSAIIRAARRIFAAQFYDQVLRPAFLILLMSGAMAMATPPRPAVALMFTALSALAALVLLVMNFRSVFSRFPRTAPDYASWRRWLAVSLPLLIIGVTQELLNQLEIILLGSFADARAAGLFSAASRLASLVPFALVALGVVSAPMISSAYHRGDFVELNRISGLAARIALGFAVVVGVGLVIAGRLLLGVFGPEFVQAYPALLILLVGGMINASTGVVAYLLTLTGRERHALLIFVGALAISLVLNFILIPPLGIEGAALASTAALSMWNLLMAVYVRRVIGVDATAFARPARPVSRPA